MPNITVRSMESIEPYSGSHKIEGIRFLPAAAALGVRAWGMNLLEIEAGCENYPAHDHTGDGQEEVYVILRGSARLVTADTEQPLRVGDLARVGPSVTRKIVPGPEGVTMLAIGGTPGKAYPAKG